jgi:hypothetical protein
MAYNVKLELPLDPKMNDSREDWMKDYIHYIAPHFNLGAPTDQPGL